MKLKLDIEIGNDAMQTGADLAEALRAQADILQNMVLEDGAVGMRQTIFDENGNTVGHWEITE